MVAPQEINEPMSQGPGEIIKYLDRKIARIVAPQEIHEQ